MGERFLRGDDSDYFDYSAVDGDTTLDVSAEAERDKEESYFDEGEDASHGMGMCAYGTAGPS